MSRRDRNDPLERKKQRNEDPQQEQEEQAEQQQEAEKKQEQSRDAAQDQLGNQGVAAMLGVSSVRPGEAGLSVDALQNREEEHDRMQLGGEEPPPDGPITLDDLVRSWNPTTRRGQDTKDQALGLYHPLPPEDEALLQEILQDKAVIESLSGSVLCIDPLIQPPPEALLEDLGPLVRQAARLATPSLLHRTWTRAASPPAPLLTDPHGRLLHTRARTAALASLLAMDGLEARKIDGRASPMILFLLDLAGRSRCIDEALDQVRASEVRLPLARDVLTVLLGDLPGGSVSLHPLPPGAANHLVATLVDLMALPPPAALVPSLVEPTSLEAPEEDPLGLDPFVDGVLGMKDDPLAGIYDAQLQAAEKMAGATARLRVHAAGMLLALARTASSWSSGAPREALLSVAGEVDRAAGEALQLLVEVGRAVQRRTVPPAGVRNGLRRVARMLEQLETAIPGWVVPIVGGIVPRGPDLPPIEPGPVDVLTRAWAEGDLSQALPWLVAQGDGLPQRVAVALTRASAGALGELAPEAQALVALARASGSPVLGAALSLCAGAALVHAGDLDQALAWARRELKEALTRRNGIWLAASALVAIDVHELRGEHELAQRVRKEAARTCWLLGARAGLSVLLRWQAPSSEEEEVQGWYGYPTEEA